MIEVKWAVRGASLIQVIHRQRQAMYALKMRSERARTARIPSWALAPALGALGAASLALLATVLAKRPSGLGPWMAEFEKTATATFHEDDTVTLHDARDWTYADGAILSQGWRDVTVDPASITGASFYIEPFAAWTAVGHAFLSFEFADGAALSFSVEAKRRLGQVYSAVRGAFRAFELAYQWGTERDFVTRRLLYLQHPLRRYPLAIDAAAAQALFRGLAEETNAIAERPRFYNSLTQNCTNVLAYIVNRRAPGTLPRDVSWYLPGYADEYLMRQGFIATDGGTIDGTKALHDLAPHRAAIAAFALKPPSSFSAQLRALPPAAA